MGPPTSNELYVISQNRTSVLKVEDIQEIRLMGWHNPLSEILPTDMEAENSKANFIRVSPSEKEIKEEEESIKKWREGKIA